MKGRGFFSELVRARQLGLERERVKDRIRLEREARKKTDK